MKRKKWLKQLIIAAAALLVVAVMVFITWAMLPYQADADAVQILNGDGVVEVGEDQNWIYFISNETLPSAGFVLYPGGRVEPEAYASLARDIAACGNLVVIPRMPLNLAVLGVNRADQVIDAYPEIEYWAVGGHSLGGAMASAYTARQTGKVDGLILWAAFPGEGTDLSRMELRVLSIFGTDDLLATPREIRDRAYLLPEDTNYLLIEGGNHAGFGNYGPQAGDGAPGISRQTQQERIVTASCAFLEQLGDGNEQ